MSSPGIRYSSAVDLRSGAYIDKPNQGRQMPKPATKPELSAHARTYRDLRYVDRAALKKRDPKQYDLLRSAWLAAGSPIRMEPTPPEAA